MINAPLLVEERDVRAVARQMRTQWIGRGFHVRFLEILMARWVRARYAVALGSGTAALTAAFAFLPGSTVHVHLPVCNAVYVALALARKRISQRSKARLTVYPECGGDIEDYARYLPKWNETELRGRYGVFSFGALKDVTGGIGGCLVSNTPFLSSIEYWKRVSPLSDINAALILSQLERYKGHHKARRVADGKLWIPPA